MVVVGQKFGGHFVRVLKLVGTRIFVTKNLLPFVGYANEAFFVHIPYLNARIFERRGVRICVVREEEIASPPYSPGLRFCIRIGSKVSNKASGQVGRRFRRDIVFPVAPVEFCPVAASTLLLKVDALVEEDVVTARAGPNTLRHTNRIFIGGMRQRFLAFVVDNLYHTVGCLDCFQNSAIIYFARNVVKESDNGDT